MIKDIIMRCGSRRFLRIRPHHHVLQRGRPLLVLFLKGIIQTQPRPNFGFLMVDNSEFHQDREQLLTLSQLPRIVNVAAKAEEMLGSKDEAVGRL
jgi:hypothetical protein